MWVKIAHGLKGVLVKNRRSSLFFLLVQEGEQRVQINVQIQVSPKSSGFLGMTGSK